MKLAMVEFREGWNFVRTGNAQRLEKKIQTRGWNFIRIADGLLRSGVGDTSQQAIASALKLALRRVSGHFNAVEVEHIELTRYPWFFLARVKVYPYRIQQGAVLPISDAAMPDPVPLRPRRFPDGSAALFPKYNRAIPLLRELLVASHSSEVGPQ
jgi:hypothetical protein